MTLITYGVLFNFLSRILNTFLEVGSYNSCELFYQLAQKAHTLQGVGDVSIIAMQSFCKPSLLLHLLLTLVALRAESGLSYTLES